MSPDFRYEPGTNRLQEGELAQIFIPDLPRGLDEAVFAEVGGVMAFTAAAVFLRQPERERGLIVGGDSMRPIDGQKGSITDILLREGIPREAIITTASGADPVTNFIRGQELFRRNSPIGIVTPSALWPLHRHVAEATMIRAYGGLLVEGLPDEHKLRLSDLMRSRRVARGHNPRRPDLARAEKRAMRSQRVAQVLNFSGTGARFYGA